MEVCTHVWHPLAVARLHGAVHSGLSCLPIQTSTSSEHLSHPHFQDHQADHILLTKLIQVLPYPGLAITKLDLPLYLGTKYVYLDFF